MVNLPLEGKGDRLRWMRCIIRTNFLAYLTRSAIPAYGGHLISRLRRQLEVNCRVAAREATLGCLLKEKPFPVSNPVRSSEKAAAAPFGAADNI